MSEHEKRLRSLLDFMRAQYPHHGHEAVLALDAILSEQRVTGLEDAMGVLAKRQATLDKQRAVARSRSNAEVADMKREGAMCSYGIYVLRAEAGRRKKGAKG